METLSTGSPRGPDHPCITAGDAGLMDNGDGKGRCNAGKHGARARSERRCVEHGRALRRLRGRAARGRTAVGDGFPVKKLYTAGSGPCLVERATGRRTTARAAGAGAAVIT